MSQNFPHMNDHEDSNMYKVEVNLDDISGEWLGFVMDKLFEAGANDVFYSPIYMKKNRPGVMLQLLCDQSKLLEIKQIIFTETTTLGIRYYPLTVHRLERRFFTLDTKWGKVLIKEGLFDNKVIQQSPEYEDCKNIAEKENIPLKYVYDYIWRKLESYT